MMLASALRFIAIVVGVVVAVVAVVTNAVPMLDVNVVNRAVLLGDGDPSSAMNIIVRADDSVCGVNGEFKLANVFGACECDASPTLAPTAVTPPPATSSEVTIRGMLTDLLCWESPQAFDGAKMKMDPETHGVHCLLLPQCAASGFGLLERTKFETPVVATGWLVDMLCWDFNLAADGTVMNERPERHTVWCLLLQQCIDSNFGIVDADRLALTYRFDTESRETTVAWAKQLDPSIINNVRVRVRGMTNVAADAPRATALVGESYADVPWLRVTSIELINADGVTVDASTHVNDPDIAPDLTASKETFGGVVRPGSDAWSFGHVLAGRTDTDATIEAHSNLQVLAMLHAVNFTARPRDILVDIVGTVSGTGTGAYADEPALIVRDVTRVPPLPLFTDAAFTGSSDARLVVHAYSDIVSELTHLVDCLRTESRRACETQSSNAAVRVNYPTTAAAFAAQPIVAGRPHVNLVLPDCAGCVCADDVDGGGGGDDDASANSSTGASTPVHSAQHSLLDDRFRLHWTVDDADDSIVITMTAKTTGYVAVAWPAVYGNMLNADGVIGRFAGDATRARVDDIDIGSIRLGLVVDGVRPDTDANHADDVVLLSSTLIDGWSSFTFRRPLRTSDPMDRAIVGGEMPTNVAFGVNDVIAYHGTSQRAASRLTYFAASSTGSGGVEDIAIENRLDQANLIGSVAVGAVDLEYRIDTELGEAWFSISANTRGYVSFGFSPNGFMIGSRATVGWQSVDGDANVFEYDLNGKTVASVERVVPHKLLDSAVTVVNGRVNVRWRRAINVGDHVIDVDGGTQVVWAIGASAFPAPHNPMGAGTINFRDGTFTAKEQFDFRLMHAVIMISACGVMMPMGVVFSVLVGREQQQVFFHYHRQIELASIVVVLIGVIIGFVSVNETDGEHFREFHPVQGVLVTTLVIVQVASGLFRAKHGSKWRHKWSVVHKFMGRATILLGILQVYAGAYYYGQLTLQDMKPWLIAFSAVLIPMLMLGP